jgi:hypothetical protein
MEEMVEAALEPGPLRFTKLFADSMHISISLCDVVISKFEVERKGGLRDKGPYFDLAFGSAFVMQNSGSGETREPGSYFVACVSSRSELEIERRLCRGTFESGSKFANGESSSGLFSWQRGYDDVSSEAGLQTSQPPAIDCTYLVYLNWDFRMIEEQGGSYRFDVYGRNREV